ncbi:glycosyl transferase [Vibrio aquaticus]|uniref:Glycosyl transferase n=1 Tax=Vibrio aquaticus TaxID=2496559 RepID=A0A3S0PQ85_9VIBR|nr:ATP-grasp fold amidoligase family protein [Vibrio aquaticus]RTZ17429.1 glycosyl transferase [Vibrio aquaticus]
MLKTVLLKFPSVYKLIFSLEKVLFRVKYIIKSPKSLRIRKYNEVHGYYPNLIEPRSFSELIQVRSLDLAPNIYSELTDKYKVRDWVLNRIGEEYLVPLYDVFKKPEDIDFEALPKEFVLKCNHDSRSAIVCKNRDVLDKSDILFKITRSFIRNYYHHSLEAHYRHIKPVILCEKLLSDSSGQLIDYKFHVFHKKIELIQVDVDRSNGIKRNVYDEDWNSTDISLNGVSKGQYFERPSNFELMKSIAINLSDDFDYVRVDLYNVDGKIYFGEMTFTPGSGLSLIEPISENERLGRLWKQGRSDEK